MTKSQTVGGGLKDEISDFKRRRIREETTHLFYENGYAGTTIDAIAERLDVTKPFIYSYYKNKSELLYEICRTGISLSLAAMDEVCQEDFSPAAKLSLVSERVLRIIIDYQEYIVVYEREEKNLEPKQAREIRELRTLFDHRLAEILQQGHAVGEFVIEDPVLTATTVAGMMTWVSFWYSPRGKRSATEIIAHTIAMIDIVVKRADPRLPAPVDGPSV
ncbi:MAG: TetR/AcrR family transcriptional regulator [Pseudomonadota bacterium]